MRTCSQTTRFLHSRKGQLRTQNGACEGVSCDLMGEALSPLHGLLPWEIHGLPDVPEATGHPDFVCATNETSTNLVRE
jgi:hypothetical protein